MDLDTPARRHARRYSAARAHADAHAKHKKAAYDNGVTSRTERRWRTPSGAQGSPQEQYDRYLATAQDPWRLEAHNRSVVMQRHLGSLSRQQIVERIHELHRIDPAGEAEDNAARVTRGLPLLERAAICERDAAHDIELSALYTEAAARGISETEIFGR